MSRKREKLDVYSPMEGKVKFVLRTKSPYGRRVYIEYDECILMFAHLDQILVKEGQEVDAGEVIGVMGKTGFSESIHLHVSAFNKRARKLTADWTIDPTFILKLAPEYCCNMKVSNGYGSKFHNPKLTSHEGVDFSGIYEAPDYDTKRIDPLYADYRLKRDYPDEYKD